MHTPAQRQAVHDQALALIEQLQSLATQQPPEHRDGWLECVGCVQEVAQFLDADGSRPLPKRTGSPFTREQLQQFGKLLRDRRNAAGLSRVQLARRAKLSDATIKFTETARHPPSRATLIRLIGVSELKLSWADVPGQHAQPPAQPSDDKALRDVPLELPGGLNCLLVPSYDPLVLIADHARFLNGAGGYVEQTSAYLDSYSAAAYLALCRNSLLSATLRSSMPLGEIAKQVVPTSGRAELAVIALGAGDGISETNLVGNLLEAGAPGVDLCLLDISQQLLTCANRYAVELLGAMAKVKVWSIQGNFHHLPFYTAFHQPAVRRRHRRLFTMLGGTLGNLDHEPRFLRQGLLDCAVDDLLLLDVQMACSSTDDPAEIKRRDRLFTGGVPAQYAAWLGGPIWRHCEDVDGIDFHWNLETRCPVPGSYALHAVATVRSRHRPDRQFSLFRFARYNPLKLAECLNQLGWEEIGAVAYGGGHSLRLYRKRSEGKVGVSHQNKPGEPA